MTNISDALFIQRKAKEHDEWIKKNNQEGQGMGMDAATFAELVKLIASLLEGQRKPEPQQQEEDQTNFAERMNVDMNNVGKPKTTKSASVRKDDVWAVIEKRAAVIQQQQPELTQAAAVTKVLETEEGAALYGIYKNIR